MATPPPLPQQDKDLDGGRIFVAATVDQTTVVFSIALLPTNFQSINLDISPIYPYERDPNPHNYQT